MLSHWIQAVMCHLYARQRKRQIWFIFLHIITLYSLAFWQFISPFYCEEALECGTTATRYIFTPNICLLISLQVACLCKYAYLSTAYAVQDFHSVLRVSSCKQCVCSWWKKLYNWEQRGNIENVFARWEETVKTWAALLQYTKHNMVLLKNKTTLDICTAA